MSEKPPDQPPASESELADATIGRDGLAIQLRQLEAFAARSEADGESLPPEAAEMIARLREIVQALDGLTASMTEAGIDAPTNRDDSPDTR